MKKNRELNKDRAVNTFETADVPQNTKATIIRLLGLLLQQKKNTDCYPVCHIGERWYVYRHADDFRQSY